jgi:hypothetical protein
MSAMWTDCGCRWNGNSKSGLAHKMQIHEKYNFTSFAADFGFCLDKDGLEYAVAVLKATYHFDSRGLLTVPARTAMCPVFLQDEYYDQPDNSSLKYPSDVLHFKEGTDVIINGHAYGRHRKAIEAGFRLGPLEKSISVYGERHWDSVMGMDTILGPVPFDRMALTYENAFGGSFVHDKFGLCRNPFNPVGKGFGSSKGEQYRLPNLEYPRQGIQDVKEPPPASLGALPGWWRQRSRHAGTFDQTWFDTRRPLLPLDFDCRFYNAVAGDQIYRPKLLGGETLTLINLHPDEENLRITIPTARFVATFRIKERTETIAMVIDTLVVEPDENRFFVSYRSAVVIGNDIKFLKSIHFEQVE